jgi:hypothetical protein
MKKIRNLNLLLIVIIVVLLSVILSFNYGYSLGERRGYVMGVQKCLEGMEDHRQTKNHL